MVNFIHTLMVEINFGCLSTMEIKSFFFFFFFLQNFDIIKGGKHLEVDLTVIGNFFLEN
jgi:hypothetical protein